MTRAKHDGFGRPLGMGTRLRDAGLPPSEEDAIGRRYRFICEHGSHHHVLCGTIQAIELSDEGGLALYVTNPRFWDKRLISITHNNGKWMAYVEVEPRQWSDRDLERMSEEEHDRVIAEEIAAKFFEGRFKLL